MDRKGTDMTDEAQDQPGTAVAVSTPTDEWLGKQTGVEMQVLDDGRKLFNLPRELGERFVMLVPASQVIQLDRSYTPVPRLVTIDIRPVAKGGDVYKVGRVQDASGKWVDQVTLTSRALAQIAERAGIEHVETRRVHFPDGQGGLAGCETIVTVRHRGPDGVWVLTTKSKVTNFEQREERVRIDAIEKAKKDDKPEPSEDELHKLVARDRTFIYEMDETKATSRAIRAITGASSYPVTELTKRQGRFLVVNYAFTPDVSTPEGRVLVDANYGRAVAELFEGRTPAPQPQVREEIEGPKTMAEFAERPIPDDEDNDGLDEDGEGGEEPEVVDGEADPGDGEEPEEVDVDEDPGEAEGEAETLWPDEDAGEKPGKPAGRPMKVGAGPYKGQLAEQVVQTEDGLKWLAVHTRRMSTDEKRTKEMCLLSWAVGRTLTFEDLDQIAPPA
jgi:hypothetical protein